MKEDLVNTNLGVAVVTRIKKKDKIIRKIENILQLSEAGVIAAFFISPTGKIIYAGARHIDMVLKQPKKFGVSKEYIQKIYEKHGEKLGIEGNAREEIMIKIVNKGWIRIRRYPNVTWSINISRMNKRVKDFLYQWANKILKGIQGFRERDKYMPVSVVSLAGDFSGNYTVDDISKDIFVTENIEFELIESNIEELPDLI